MTTYKLTFNSNSKARKIPRAIKIAKTSFSKTITETLNSISIVSFECNRSFKNILRLVKNIKGTKLEVNNELVVEIDQFISIQDCENKRSCQGICTAIGDYDFQLGFIGISGNDNSGFYNSARWRLFYHDDAIQKSTPSQMVLKKDIYLKHYLDDTSLAEKICYRYNRDKILDAFNALPKLIEIELSGDDYASIFDRLMDRDRGGVSENTEGEMTVNLSKMSIEAIGEEIIKRLDIFFKSITK